MTLSEFKAWFEGFSEGINGAPTEAQFDKIKAKVAEINGVALTREVVVERYRDIWSQPLYPRHVPVWYGGNYGLAATAGDGNGRFSAVASTGFDSHAAMRVIGANESLAV